MCTVCVCVCAYTRLASSRTGLLITGVCALLMCSYMTGESREAWVWNRRLKERGRGYKRSPTVYIRQACFPFLFTAQRARQIIRHEKYNQGISAVQLKSRCRQIKLMSSESHAFSPHSSFFPFLNSAKFYYRQAFPCQSYEYTNHPELHK